MMFDDIFNFLKEFSLLLKIYSKTANLVTCLRIELYGFVHFSIIFVHFFYTQDIQLKLKVHYKFK